MKRANLLALLLLISSASFSGALVADDVVVENRGKRTFYYSLRDHEGAAWSDSHELASGEQRSHTSSGRLQISYLTDDAHFAWLEGSQTYRIENTADGQLRPLTQVRRPAVPDSVTDPAASDVTTTGETTTGESATGDPITGAPVTSGTSETAAPTSRSDDAAVTARDASAPADSPADSPADAETAAAPSNSKSTIEEPFDALFDVTNRVVTVRAIADVTYRDAFPEWRERAQQIIDDASAYYRRNFSIRLVLTETRPWEYDAVEDDLETRWARLLEVAPKQVDLIVALVGYGEYSRVEGEAALTGQLGRGAFFGQHLMVADRQDYHENRAKTILIHELGHVFGAFHVDDKNTMMYPAYFDLPSEQIIAGTVPFGPTNDQIFAITKEFDFRAGVAGLSPENQHRIQALYRQHGIHRETQQTDPITSGYQYLQRRAEIVAEQMKRRAEASRGTFDSLTE